MGLVSAKCSFCGADLQVNDSKQTSECPFCFHNIDVATAIVPEDNNMIAIICPSCGSNDIKCISEDLGICQSCKTKIYLPAKKKTNVIHNEIHVHSVQNSANGIDVYEIIKTGTEKKFLRNTLLYLAMNENVPSDIFESEFGTVACSQSSYATVEANVSTNYSVLIGTKRQETYFDTVSKYNATTKQTEKEIVQKTRTVTDWSPLSSSNYSRETNTICLGTTSNKKNKLDDYFIFIKDRPKSLIEGNFDTSVSIYPTEQQIDTAKRNCEQNAEYFCESHLPGDEHKNFYANSTSEIKSIKSYVVPQYEMSYKYKDDKYEVLDFAVEKELPCICKCPSIKESLEKAVEKEVRPFSLSAMVSLFATIVLSLIFFIIACVSISNAVRIAGTIICLICLAGGIIMFSIYKVQKKKISNSMHEELQNKKAIELGKLLTKLDLERLTQKEIDSIKHGWDKDYNEK